MSKIFNKERNAFRGPKCRYAIFRSELNRFWEEVYKRIVIQICEDNSLATENHIVSSKKRPWKFTYDRLKEKGYYLLTRSIKDIQTDVERTAKEEYKGLFK